MGGEKRLKPYTCFSIPGSPPHGRGKTLCHIQSDIDLGITPAQAGKSKLALCTPSCPTDHPRACGEKNKELEGVWLPMGSPPHGRGKECRFHQNRHCRRITPAWTGKSRSAISAHSVGQDHPRVGEEKFEDVRNIVGQIGSSPRRRGKDGNEVQLIAAEGITPAWAGKSLRCCNPSAST